MSLINITLISPGDYVKLTELTLDEIQALWKVRITVPLADQTGLKEKNKDLFKESELNIVKFKNGNNTKVGFLLRPEFTNTSGDPRYALLFCPPGDIPPGNSPHIINDQDEFNHFFFGIEIKKYFH